MKLAQAKRDLENARGAERLDASEIVRLRGVVANYERGIEVLEEEFAGLFPA